MTEVIRICFFIYYLFTKNCRYFSLHFVTLRDEFTIMHELSIALGIVKIAEDETAKVKAEKVTKIELVVGVLSGIELDSLNFVWESAVKDTVLEHALKKIIVVEGRGKCIDCDTEFEMENMYDCCPNCNSNFKGILKGKELKVKALEVI